MLRRTIPSRATMLTAACYAVSATACCALAAGRHAAFADLRIYRSGGAAVLHGSRLYDLRFAWNLGFTYPPFAALAFTVFAAAPWRLVPPLVTAASVLLLPVTCWLALRLPRGPRAAGGRSLEAPGRAGWRVDRALTATGVPFGRLRRLGEHERQDGPVLGPHHSPAGPRPVAAGQAAALALAAAAAMIWLEPVRTNLAYGQINIVLAALILADLGASDRARLKGAAIGLAAGLKLTPAIFTVYLLATRRYRAAMVSAAAFCVTVAVGFAAAPADSAQFWAGQFADPLRVGRIENAANQSLRGALARLLHTASVEPVWLGVAAVTAAGGLLLAAMAGRRGDEAAGFSICAVTGLLVSPVSWSHHWVLAVPAVVILAVSAWQLRSAAAGAAAALLAVIGWSRIIWQVPIGQGRHAELHLGLRQLGYADAYVLAGCAVLAVAAWKLVFVAGRVKEHPDGRGGTDSDVVPAAHDLDGPDAGLGEPPRHGGRGRAAVRLLSGQHQGRASGAG